MYKFLLDSEWSTVNTWAKSGALEGFQQHASFALAGESVYFATDSEHISELAQQEFKATPVTEMPEMWNVRYPFKALGNSERFF